MASYGTAELLPSGSWALRTQTRCRKVANKDAAYTRSVAKCRLSATIPRSDRWEMRGSMRVLKEGHWDGHKLRRQASISAKKSFGVECRDWIKAHCAQRRDIAGRERDSR